MNTNTFPYFGYGLLIMLCTTLGVIHLQRVEDQAAEVTARLDNLPVVETLTHQQIRQALWEGMRACGTSTIWNAKSMPDTYPNDEWCKAWQAKLAAEDEERQRERDLDTMIDCIWEGGRREDFEKYGHIDRVDHPRWRQSWVLSGDCETLAHRLQTHYNMCLDWVDDDPETAGACRLEMVEYVTTFCARDDISDDEKRECRSHY